MILIVYIREELIQKKWMLIHVKDKMANHFHGKKGFGVINQIMQNFAGTMMMVRNMQEHLTIENETRMISEEH